MQLINEACVPTGQIKNIGGKDQCFEGLVKTIWPADDNFSFPDIATAKLFASAMAAVKAKSIIPLPNVENPTANNTEAQVKNGAWADYVLKEGVPGVTYRIDTAVCTHAALKSLENSKYSRRLFEVTDKDELICDIDDEGRVWGRKVTSFSVGLRNQRTAEDVPFTNLSIKFENDTPSVLKVGYEADKLEGIYDVLLVQDSASATSIQFKVNTDCSATSVLSLEQDDFVLKNASGQVQSITAFTEADVDGIYTITGTGFTNGYTVELDGVVAQGGKHYEDVEPLVVSI